MARKQKEVGALGSQFTLIWTAPMVAVLWKVLVEQHHLGKRSDTGWKNEAWTAAQEAIQCMYKGGNEHRISVEKIKGKVDAIYTSFYFS